MKKPFGKLFMIPLMTLFLASLALVPVVEARKDANRSGGGGHSNGGKGEGGKKNVQVNNSKRDVRTTNVRSTSNTNVNVNRNTNVNVNVNNRHGGGWDDDHHPIATAAAVTATAVVTAAVVGSIVNSVPPGCVPVNYNGMVYQQCGSTWYQPQYVGSQVQYVVIVPPR